MLIAALLVLMCFTPPFAAPQAPDPRLKNPVVPSVFVLYNPGSLDNIVASAIGIRSDSRYVAAQVSALKSGGAAGALPVHKGETPEQAAARYRKVPGVTFAAPNLWVGKAGIEQQAAYDPAKFPFVPPLDPLWGESYAFVRTSAAYVWGRNVAGRSVNTNPDWDGDETRVCIIDSGVDCGHPELRNWCVAGAAFLPNGTRAYGLQWAADEDGHGTHMAGLVAAAADGAGMAGMLQRGSALYVCKFMDASGFGTIGDAYSCLDWCIANRVSLSIAAWGTNIGDMEWNGPNKPGSMYWKFAQLLQKQGRRHLLVAAAGNHGRQLYRQGKCPSFFFMPAQLHLSNMLVVGATDERETLWQADAAAAGTSAGGGGKGGCPAATADDRPVGSNYGSDWVDIAAPGSLVWTTSMRTQEEIEDGLASYQQVSGTSVATALVGGAAGLILSATANDAVQDMGEVRAALLAGADTVGGLAARLGDNQRVVSSGRRLNCYNALWSYLDNERIWPRLPPQLCGIVPGTSNPEQFPQSQSKPPPPLPPSPKPPKPRPPSPRPPSPRPPSPRPPRPRPPPPSPVPICPDGFHWDGQRCAQCQSRFGVNCVLCIMKKCLLSCKPTDAFRAPCSLYIGKRRGS